MKRDMELIKAILIDLEKNCDGSIYYSPESTSVPYDFKGTESEFNEHCRLIAERGLANYQNSVNKGIFFLSLTWDGHDFLDNARESKVWDAAKKAAGGLSFVVFKEVLIRAATAFAIKQLGIQ